MTYLVSSEMGRLLLGCPAKFVITYFWLLLSVHAYCIAAKTVPVHRVISMRTN